MKYAILICLFGVCASASSQLKVEKLSVTELPAGVKYKGRLKQAAKWVDSSGTHLVLATETGITESKTGLDETYNDAELYAYHYQLDNDSLKLTWRVYDFIKECPVDITASFVKNTFAITDLNRNGHAEVWLMYKVVCRGDVSPSDMRVIMYENGKKHAMRGTNKVKLATESYGGNYSFDEAFRKSDEAIKTYAQKLWKANLIENWD